MFRKRQIKLQIKLQSGILTLAAVLVAGASSQTTSWATEPGAPPPASPVVTASPPPLPEIAQTGTEFWNNQEGACRTILRAGKPSSFDPLKMPWQPYDEFWKENLAQGWQNWEDTPECKTESTQAAQLFGRSVRVAWAMDRSIRRVHYVEGKIKDVDFDGQTVTLAQKGAPDLVVPLIEAAGEKRFFYLHPSEPPVPIKTLLPQRLWAADLPTLKIEEIEKEARKNGLSLAEQLWRDQIERVTRDSVKKDEDDAIEDKIRFWMDATGHHQRAALTADSDFVNLVTTQLRYGQGTTVSRKLKALFEEVELAYVRIRKFRQELAGLSQRYAEGTLDFNLTLQSLYRENKIEQSEPVLVEKFYRYTWVRRVLAGMADGFDDCGPSCAQKAKWVMQALGITDRLRKKYPGLLGDVRRPSVQEIQLLFDEDPKLVEGRIRYELKMERASGLQAIFIVAALAQSVQESADIIQNVAIKTFVKRFMYMIGDLRARRDHFPLINEIRFTAGEFPSEKEALPIQLEQLEEFEAPDKTILITFSRTVEAKPLWRNLLALAKTEDEDFYKKMVAAQTEGDLLGDLSTLYQVTPISKWVGGVTAVGGVYWATHQWVNPVAIESFQKIIETYRLLKGY